MKKKIWAVLLSSAIALSGVPVSVLAAEDAAIENGFSDGQEDYGLESNREDFPQEISDKEFDFTSDIDSYEGSVSIDTNSINSGSCGDNVTWSLSGSVVTITGNGKMKDFSYDEVKPWNDATEVIVENGVTGIGEYAFQNCPKLQTIKIPASVTLIGSMESSDYFQGCIDAFDYDGGSLINIEVSEDNSIFSSWKGVLYSKDKTKLLYFPRQITSIEIPKETKNIYVSAVACCEKLSSVAIPEGVESIGICAFEHCYGLLEIVIPISVNSIGTRAFYKSTPLFKVCGNSYGESYAKQNNYKYEVTETHIHTWDEGTIEYEPNCEDEGSILYKCTTCGTEKRETIPKRDHVLVREDAEEATCTEYGYTGDWYCALCDELIKEGTVIPKKNHAWDKGTVTKAATCVTNGVKTYTCTVGGEERTESIPAKGHAWSAWKVVKAASVSGEGLQQRTCKNCEKVESKSIAKLTSTQTIPSTLTVKAGKTSTLKPASSWKNVKYSTSNKKIVTVDKKGKVKGVSAGTAKITVKSGSKRAVCTITVPGTTAIKNIKSSINVKKGKSTTLKPKLSYAGSPDTVTYKSSNKKIAIVSKYGKITGKKKGTATITIKSGKITKKCKVKVK